MYQGNDCMSQISGLLDCYGQVQAATAFIKQVLASTPMPMKGVTDGSNALPGQVGEFVTMTQTKPVAATGGSSTSATLIFPMGTLQPGDWHVWAVAQPTVLIDWVDYYLTTQPAGFSGNMASAMGSGSGVEGVSVPSNAVQALISVPTLVAFTLNYSSTIAGSMVFTFSARRMR